MNVFRIMIKTPTDGEHGIARYAVMPGLRAPLPVDCVLRGGELVQKVEALYLGYKLAFEEDA